MDFQSYYLNGSIYTSEPDGLIGCYMALAKRDYADGVISKLDYDRFVQNVEELSQRFSKAGIPLDAITHRSGLDKALQKIEKESTDKLKNVSIVNFA